MRIIINGAGVVGSRRPEAAVYEPVVSIPAQYAKKPLLRSGQ
jgi:hypothetical protein